MDHTSVVFDDKLWVIGGWDNETGTPRNLNDVWYSSNGASWTQATAHAGFGPRWEHSSVVYDDKIWVIGGIDSAGNALNDVWYSADGANWTASTLDAEFDPICMHTTVVLDNKMWILGGQDNHNHAFDNVWYAPGP